MAKVQKLIMKPTIVSNPVFSDIERRHTEWSRMDKMARLACLKGQWDSLNQIAYQYGVYLMRKTSITQVERRYAQCLVDMINSVDAEGAKLMNELTLDVLRELCTRLKENINNTKTLGNSSGSQKCPLIHSPYL